MPDRYRNRHDTNLGEGSSRNEEINQEFFNKSHDRHSASLTNTDGIEDLLATVHRLQEMLSIQEHKHSEQMQAMRDFMAEKDVENRKNTRILEKQLSESISDYEKRQHALLDEQKQLKALTMKQTKELETAKEKYTQEFRELLQSTSNEYIDTTISKHESRKESLESTSFIWGLLGALSVVVGVVALVAMAFTINPLDARLTVGAISYVSVRSAIFVALILVLVKYCYTQSRQSLVESLRIASRINAIEFGAFYLKTYGANTEWKELRDVFRGWEGVSIVSDDIAFSNSNTSDAPGAKREPRIDVIEATSH